MLPRLIPIAAAGLLLAAAPPKRLGTIRQQVRRAKPELLGQPSLPAYHESPYQPAEIVERIHGLESVDAWAELCRELALLPDDELELFEDAVRKPEHVRRLPCGDALLARIATYWRSTERRMATVHPIASTTVLPSRRIPVDTSKDPIFTDGHLADDEIALTFDDGPHPERTQKILRILAAAHVEAMFFEIGRNASAHPDVARSVLAAGHTVGSHTFSHPNMTRVDERHAESEVDSGDASVSLALGLRPGQLPFFRFPYGAKTPPEQSFVSRRGNTTVFWNMDSQDWKIRDPHRLFLNVLAELDRAKHGIILFHDIHEQTVIVLPHVLAELQARHLKTVVFVAAPSAPPAVPSWER